MRSCASRARTVSRATPTTMMMEVPPREMPVRAADALKCAIRMGTTAMMPSYIAPNRVILFRTFWMNSLVGLPGRKPGMYPPFFFRLFATSMGLNWMVE